ncbi:MAG: T9SS type A sorting domain-containing protein, partial [Bacteroidota bacterium]
YLAPEYALDNFTIEDGTVLLGENAWLDPGNATLRYVDAHFTALDPAKPYRTVFYNGQNNHVIQGNLFSHGQTGLTARSFAAQGAPPLVRNCTFEFNHIGLRTYSKGAYLKGCTFRSNLVHGWEMLGASFGSTFDASTAIGQGGMGIYYGGLSRLHLREAQLTNNLVGVLGYGGSEVTAHCGSITNNSGQGMIIAGNSTLNLGNISRLDLTDNPISILLSQAGGASLYKGENTLIPVQEGQQDILIGSMIAACSTHIQAHRNHWNSRPPLPNGAIPSSTLDYSLIHFGLGCPLYVVDPTPVPSLACGDPPFPAIPLPPCPGCERIAGEGEEEEFTLSEVADDALQLMYTNDSTYQDPVAAMPLWASILQHDYEAVDSLEYDYLHFAYAKLKECLGWALANREISIDGADHTPHFQADAQLFLDATADLIALQQQDIPRKADYTIGERAAFMAQMGRADLALPILDGQIGGALSHEATDFLTYWRCLVVAEDQVRKGDWSLAQAEDSLVACLPTLTFSREASPFVQSAASDFPAVEVYPNPTSASVWVAWPGNTRPVVELIDLEGRKLKQWDFRNTQEARNKLSLREFPAGMYVLHLRWTTHQQVVKVVRQ